MHSLLVQTSARGQFVQFLTLQLAMMPLFLGGTVDFAITWVMVEFHFPFGVQQLAFRLSGTCVAAGGGNLLASIAFVSHLSADHRCDGQIGV